LQICDHAEISSGIEHGKEICKWKASLSVQVAWRIDSSKAYRCNTKLSGGVSERKIVVQVEVGVIHTACQ